MAEEALAIAVACALAARDFEDGVLLAANHSGDRDSTAAIPGNLLGAALGEAAIAVNLVTGVEMRAEIKRLSGDLNLVAQGEEPSFDDYPGW